MKPMTQKQKEREIKKLQKKLTALRTSPEAREAWIKDHMNWLGVPREKAENSLLKEITFLQATINVYSRY